MALGNLAIKVTADVGSYTYSMDGLAITAKERMGQSAAAVEGFRASVLKTSQDLERAAANMGGSMQAANEEIMAGAKDASAAVADISKEAANADFTPMSEKIAMAFGNGIGAGIVAAQTAMDGFVLWVKTKAIVTGAVIAAAFAAVGLGAVYAAYKVVTGAFTVVKELMNGDFYKSENIDALIKSNNELKDLQKNLGLSSIEAGALNEAMKRLGVAPGDYKAVFSGVEKAIHSNGEELDRLGVQYKDANGKILETQQIISNAKDVLDSYTEGWDRNQAATAIGIGSYEQISEAVKVTGKEIETSKARLDEYQLGMTAGAQDMVAKYETAMREFGRETDLMGQGFKRVIADAVMPALTSLANWFKDGWPSIVRAFRVGVSTIVGLGYAMANGFVIVAEGIVAAFGIVKDVVGGVATALMKAATGDLKGAYQALVGGWDGAKDRLKIAGENIVMQVMENDKKIRLATAGDGRDASIASSKIAKKVGKSWVGKPDAPDTPSAAAATVRADPFDGAMNSLGAQKAGIDYVIANFDKFEGKVKESKAAMAEFDVTMGRFSDKQRESEKFTPLTAEQKAAYIAGNKYLQDQLEVERQMQVLRKLGKQAEQFDFKETQALEFRRQDVEWLGKSQQELAKLTEARRIDGEIAQMIHATEIELGKSGLKITQDQIDAIKARGDALKAATGKVIDEGYDKARDPWFNFQQSIRQYGEEAGNVGQQIGQAMTNAFRGAEDALVNFAMTGKLSFSDLAKSILADLARIQAKNLIASLVGDGKGNSGLIGAGLKSILGFAGGGDPPLNVPSIVGENGPELFVPKGSGTIIPNEALQGGGSGMPDIHIHQTNYIDSRTDQGAIVQIMQRTKAETKAEITREMQRSRNAYAR